MLKQPDYIILWRKVMKENIRDWLKNNEPADNLIYRDGLYDQCRFVENTLMQNLFIRVASDYDPNMGFDERCKVIENFIPSVVGTHCSKSVLLPVMEMDLSKIGLKVILRYNFYDWCISVESEKDIECDFMGLLTDEKGYFEGFPKDRIYEKYSESNKKNFSFCMDSWYNIYVFMFLLRNFFIK